MNVVKESSDELNAPTTTDGAASAPERSARSAKDYVALAIATCGVGYLPLAPGTWGSMVGVLLAVMLRAVCMAIIWPFARRNNWSFLYIFYALVTLELIAIYIISRIGIWAASRAEQLLGKKDPQQVVVDEVAGQMIALIPIPMGSEVVWALVLGFGLFRLFDIIKPYPARQLESLKSGLGIMADDLIAGFYAGLVVAFAVVIRWAV